MTLLDIFNIFSIEVETITGAGRYNYHDEEEIEVKEGNYFGKETTSNEHGESVRNNFYGNKQGGKDITSTPQLAFYRNG